MVTNLHALNCYTEYMCTWMLFEFFVSVSFFLIIQFYIISYLHNSFVFLCDVIRSLNRYDGPEQSVYWPRSYNSVSTVSVISVITGLMRVYIGLRLLHHTSYDKCDSFLIRKLSNWSLKIVFKIDLTSNLGHLAFVGS